MQPLDLLLLALGTWYVAYSVTKTHGPYHVFEKLRAALPLGGLTACIVCCAFWAALGLYLLSLVLMPLVYIFGAAGGAILLYRQTGGDHVL